MRPKGMRDIATGQRLARRTVPARREQIISELARLEHEKVRLEHTRAIWIENQRQTEDRLRQVKLRRALLQQTLEAHLAENAPRHPAHTQPATLNRSGWNNVSLEY